MKRIIIISSIVIAVVALVTWYLMTRNKNNEPQWKTATINKGNVTVSVTATGSLNAVRTVQVGAQVSGIVSKLFVDFDSVVKKGQVIALLDTTLLYSAMRDAIATVEKAKVQVELTNKQFIRTDTLFHQKVASQADYDLAYSNYKAAQAELMAATASLEHEQTNLHYATIKAPITGTVISRNVDVGQTVISSFNAPTLFTIANDLTQMQVLADVDEADIGQIKVGQQTSFTVDAYPYDKFTGTVAQIRLQPVVVQNVNNYVVVINVANPDLKLLPGLTANINIKVEERQDVLKVPINAIHFTPSTEYLQTMQLTDTLIRQIKSGKVAGNEIPRSGSTCYVWLKDGQNIKPEKITTGIFDGTYIEINGKIREGQELVTGTTSAQAAAGTSNNPFLPKMPPRRTLR